ncbi:hypothetical protein N665_5697s0001, partial [Sinapis alba]
MIQRVEMQGCSPGHNEFDDGSDHDGVTKIYVRGGLTGIHYIHFDYLKNGQTVSGPVHGFSNTGFTQTCEIDHLRDEQLISVDIYYRYGTLVVQALQFKTNLKVSEVMGYEDNCTKFTLEVDGKKIIGFHGSAAYNLFGLGAYFDRVSSSRMEAKGGNGGKEWDDGSEHEAISKIQVQVGPQGIQCIKFDYIKDGHQKDGPVHGFSDGGVTSSGSFEINYLEKEYLASIEGFYDEDSDVIQGLRFKTNMKTSEIMGYDDDDSKRFSLTTSGKKITGFHGFAEKNLNSLGVYLTTIPPTKLETKGWQEGFTWDDGAFDGVRKVYVHYEKCVINSIGFDYDNRGRMQKSMHGKKSDVCGQDGEFVVDYPNEFITCVEGSFTKYGIKSITSLTFSTSKGRTSPTFGGVFTDNDDKFVLKRNGCALIGFHARYYTSNLVSLGAYCRPLPPRSHSEKLVAKGGEGGASWDDGDNFNGIRKIFVGKGEMGIALVKFVYDKDTQVVFGDDHGNKTMTKSEE